MTLHAEMPSQATYTIVSVERTNVHLEEQASPPCEPVRSPSDMRESTVDQER